MKQSRIISIMLVLAMCLCVATSCAGGGTAVKPATTTYQEVTYSQIDHLAKGAAVKVTGEPDYSVTSVDKSGNLFLFRADGEWYVRIGTASVAQVKEILSEQEVTLYGVYSGKIGDRPIIDIRTGAVDVSGKHVQLAALLTNDAASSSSASSAASSKPESPANSEKPASSASSSTASSASSAASSKPEAPANSEKPASSAASSKPSSSDTTSAGGSSGNSGSQEEPESPTTGILVWIPTNGGTKYHRRATCSKMIDPEQVDLAYAQAHGFTACKRCY